MAACAPASSCQPPVGLLVHLHQAVNHQLECLLLPNSKNDKQYSVMKVLLEDSSMIYLPCPAHPECMLCLP